jgi:hypothetical protein
VEQHQKLLIFFVSNYRKFSLHYELNFYVVFLLTKSTNWPNLLICKKQAKMSVKKATAAPLQRSGVSQQQRYWPQLFNTLINQVLMIKLTNKFLVQKIFEFILTEHLPTAFRFCFF